MTQVQEAIHVIESNEGDYKMDKADVEFLKKQLEDFSIAVDPENRPRRQSSTSFIIRTEDSIKGLSRLLKILEEMDIEVEHIETRRPQRRDCPRDSMDLSGTPLSLPVSDIFVDIDCDTCRVDALLSTIRESVQVVAVQLPCRTRSRNPDSEDQFWPPGEGEAHAKTLIEQQKICEDISNYSKHIEDIDKLGGDAFELSPDHPGYKNKDYRERRFYFAEIAESNKYGEAIPNIEYTSTEKIVWKSLYLELSELYPTHACKQFQDNLEILQKYCDYREDDIPQLEVVSNFIRDRTGFTLRLVATELSARDFLAGLAFRVFHCTQHVRYWGQLHSTPDPDCCHDLLGHVPMLLDESYAGFLQEIGLLSLGAPDEDVWKLAKYYFFTIEYGLWERDNELRALGSALLTSVGELTLALSGKTSVLEFDPEEAVKLECEISGFPKVYYCLRDMEEARSQLREWSVCLQRPFQVIFNPYTNTVECLDSRQLVREIVSDIKSDMTLIRRAFNRLAKAECRGFSRLLGARLSATIEQIEDQFDSKVVLKDNQTSC